MNSIDISVSKILIGKRQNGAMSGTMHAGTGFQYVLNTEKAAAEVIIDTLAWREQLTFPEMNERLLADLILQTAFFDQTMH
jgi:hypothetical protein